MLLGGSEFELINLVLLVRTLDIANTSLVLGLLDLLLLRIGLDVHFGNAEAAVADSMSVLDSIALDVELASPVHLELAFRILIVAYGRMVELHGYRRHGPMVHANAVRIGKSAVHGRLGI